MSHLCVIGIHLVGGLDVYQPFKDIDILWKCWKEMPSALQVIGPEVLNGVVFDYHEARNVSKTRVIYWLLLRQSTKELGQIESFSMDRGSRSTSWSRKLQDAYPKGTSTSSSGCWFVFEPVDYLEMDSGLERIHRLCWADYFELALSKVTVSLVAEARKPLSCLRNFFKDKGGSPNQSGLFRDYSSESTWIIKSYKVENRTSTWFLSSERMVKNFNPIGGAQGEIHLGKTISDDRRNLISSNRLMVPYQSICRDLSLEHSRDLNKKYPNLQPAYVCNWEIASLT